MIPPLDFVRRKTIPLRRYLKGRRGALRYNLRYSGLAAKPGQAPQTVLFYPQHPRPDHLLYKYCHLLGYKLTSNPNRRDVTLAVRFEDTTYKKSVPELDRLLGRLPLLNYGASDGSKSAAERAFESAFGYALAVDPRTHAGPAVRKTEINAAHSGSIVACPRTPEPGYVYEKLLDSRHGDRWQDIRVPVIGDSVPFLYLKYHADNARFAHFVEATMHETDEVLSADEAAKCVAVCRAMGVDHGELDVIRDNNDGRIYVVDVNETPSGPSICMTLEERLRCSIRGAEAFRAAFVEKPALTVTGVLLAAP